MNWEKNVKSKKKDDDRLKADHRINSDNFRVRPGKKVKLSAWPTEVKAYFGSKKQYRNLLRQHTQELSSMQNKLYANDQFAVPLIFQAVHLCTPDAGVLVCDPRLN